jgi:elongation factor G
MKTTNIGIFAHIDAGKTTLTEQILYQLGAILRPGTIEEGTTESDHLPVEISRGISVFSSLLQLDASRIRSGFRINLLDTPGHLDFRNQVESVLDCIDLAIVLLDGTRGVESQTELIHAELIEKKIPEIFFINKLDRTADALPDALASLEELLGATPAILFRESDYSFIWKDPGNFSDQDHLELIQFNEELSDQYLRNPGSLHSLSRKGLILGLEQAKIFPVLGGSAYFGTGVPELLELISELQFPVPVSVPGAELIISKRYKHPDLGRLTLARALRKFRIGENLEVQNQKVPIQDAYRLTGESVEKISVLEPGDLFATGSLNHLPPPISLPDSPFVMILEPETTEDKGELDQTFSDLAWEDPSYRWESNSSLGNFLLWGRGELHLEIALERARGLMKGKFSVGELKVARYELCKNMEKKLALEHTAFDEKFSSGKLVAILRDTAGFSKQLAFEVSLPEKIQNAIETGFYEALSRGNHHLEVLGVHFSVLEYIPPENLQEATPTLLKVAILSGLRDALVGQTEIIGPVSDLEITVDDQHVGNVLSVLQKRKAQVLDIRKRIQGKSLLLARAGTENLLGFSGALRNMTKGTGISFQRNTFNPENYYVLNETRPR